jgi:N-acetyl-1-D-myo-inositol-2-amino-2-deoxy-alpha-D-glucopyranoside deacetylase
MSSAASQLSSSTAASKLPIFSGQTRLLVVAPHPDDETIAAGLLIQQVLAAGGEVRILLLTAGDNNPWPQRWLERRLRIRQADRQRWGRRRQAELQLALERLELPSSALQTLGWPDMGVTGRLMQPQGAAVSTLAMAIGQFRPSLIAMPSLGDRHPDHGAAHVLVRLALAGQPVSPQLLTYLVHGHAPGTDLVEVHGSPAQLAKKLDALSAHQSQMALSGNRMRHLAARPERYAEVTAIPEILSLERPSSALPWQPSAWLQPWLQLSVASAAGVQSWRWKDAPLRRDDHGVYHLTPDSTGASPRFAKLALNMPSLWIFDHWGWCEL